MKNYLKLVNAFVPAFILLFSLSTCRKEELGVTGFPRIRTVVVESISDTGAVFSGEIIDIPAGCEIVDHGFVWSDNKNTTNYLEKISLGGITTTGSFKANINRVMVEGKKYYFKAFVQTSDDIIYGNELEFISLGSYTPIFSSIYPETGGWLDTVVIRGKYFSNSYRMEVYFDEYPAKNCVSTDTMIKVLVPPYLDTLVNKVFIRYANVNYPGKEFHLVPNLEITSLDPASAWWNSVIRVKGKLLQLTEEVYFDNLKAIIKNRTDSLLEVVVPLTLSSTLSDISIRANKFPFTSPEKFKLLPADIKALVPSSGTWNSLVKITGKHIGLTDKVFFNGIPAKIKAKSDSIVEVFVPFNLTETRPEVTLSINNFEFMSPQPFSFIPGKSVITPATGTVSTDVTIKVNNLKSVTKVRVGTIDIPIRSKTDSSVTVRLPDLNTSGNVSFTLSDGTNEILYKDVFTFWKAVITSLNPAEISYGDSLIVTGDDLQECQSVSIGNLNAAVKAGKNQIKLLVRASEFLNSGNQTVTFNFPNQKITRSIFIKQPVITGITPATIKVGDIVTVTGENLCPYYSNMNPKIGGNTFKVISQSQTDFKMKLENSISAIGFLSFSVGANALISNNISLTVNSPWRLVTNQPWPDRPSLTGMNGNLYFIEGYTRSVLKINPLNGEKVNLPNYPSSENNAGLGIKSFVYNNQFYAGLGHYNSEESNNLFRLNEPLNKWDSVTSAPGTYYESRAAFFIIDKLYFITIQSDNSFSNTKVFNLTNNQWSEISPFPFKFSQKSVKSVVVNNNAYLFTTSEAYKFDPVSNTWTVLQKPPVVSGPGALTVFNIGTRIFCFVNQKLYEYDISSNNYVKRSDWVPHSRNSYYSDVDYYEVSASVGQTGYVGFGLDNSNLYEYNPALEP